MGAHSGFTMTGDVDANNAQTIINLKAPVNPNDAARLADVGGGGVVGASYLTLGLDVGLTAERVLTEGEGINFVDTGANGTLTVSGENATTVNKGIASFNTDDFSVAAGAVSLKNKISYISMPGNAFLGENPATDALSYSGTSGLLTSNGAVRAVAPVYLPQGAVVTGVKILGNDATNTIRLSRTTLSDGTIGQMAVGNVNTEVAAIAFDTIDNSLYCYYLKIDGMGAGDDCDGAYIKYTTDHI